MWGWDHRPGSAGSWRLSQYDEPTASTAKIIPLRPWFDPPHSRAEDSHAKFAGGKDDLAEAKAADVKAANVKAAESASVEPFRRETAKAEVKAEVKTEAKSEAKTPPGSTVVIEQAVPAPPLRTGGDKDGGGGSAGGGGGVAAVVATPRRCTSVSATMNSETCSAAVWQMPAATW